MNYLENYAFWCNADLSADEKAELDSIKDNVDELKGRFASELQFGTAGMRGIMGAGSNRLNRYTVRRAAQGMAAWLSSTQLPQSAAIAYDSVVAEKSAVVDASGKVTQIDGHAPDANRSFFDNVLGELFKPGSPFYDETGHNMFADLETAVVTDKKPLKEIATILKSKYAP